MEKDKNSKEELFFEDVVRKTKTGITFPKILREELFEEDKDIFFRLIVPKEKDKIILEILSEDQVRELPKKLKAKITKTSHSLDVKKFKRFEPITGPAINWGEVFVYDFKSKDKVYPFLESAYEQFALKPPNLEDAMGRIKYALISFLSSTKTENGKLYFSIVKFLVKIIEFFNQPNLIEWMFEKVIPDIESKFLYELSLLELTEISLKTKKYEKAEIFISHILKSIDEYPKSEMFNIINSFKQIVSKIKGIERTEKIDRLIKDKLIEYEHSVKDLDYKIQIIEFLEELDLIELAYKLAKDIQVSLPADSMRIEEIRKLVRRLKTSIITEQKDVD